MYLMYVDESGDTGLGASPTSYFMLSGLVVHESQWRDFINQLIAFRKRMRVVYALPVRSEIHATKFINGRILAAGGGLISRPDKLAILRNALDELAQTTFIRITHVVVRKAGKDPAYDVFDNAWMTLFQRFENTLSHGNFPGAFRHEKGMVITDATSGKKLLRMVRRMAVYNPVPHMAQYGQGYRNLPIVRIIEDPYPKDSAETLPIQMTDVCAYFLHQRLKPNNYIKEQSAQRYFDRLKPTLNVHATYSNKLGVVLL